MSQPPTNSPLTYTCGIVGHSLSSQQCLYFSVSPVLLDALTQFGVLETIERLELVQWYTLCWLSMFPKRKTAANLNIEDLDDGARKAALRLLGRSLHEHYQRVLVYSLALNQCYVDRNYTAHTLSIVFRACSLSHRR